MSGPLPTMASLEAKLTAALKPFFGVTVSVAVPDAPAFNVSAAGLMLSAKSGVVAGLGQATSAPARVMADSNAANGFMVDLLGSGGTVAAGAVLDCAEAVAPMLKLSLHALED